MSPAATGVKRFLARLRRRTLLLHVQRLVLVGGTTFVVSLLFLGMILPPAIGLIAAISAWAVVVAATLAACVWSLWPVVESRGGSVARHLQRRSPRIASAARSVVELADASDQTELVHAHANEVWDELKDVRPREVIPWSVAWTSRALIAAGVGLTLALVLLAGGAGKTGVYAMFHPGNHDGDAALVDIVSSLEWSCRFPSYLKRAPEQLSGAALTLPVGTVVSASMSARVNLRQAHLDIAGTRYPLEGHGREWHTTFEVTESGTILVRGRDADGQTLQDASPRGLTAVVDEEPALSIESPPLEDVDADAELTMPFTASDDHGLASVRLVVRTSAGEVIRRELFRSEAGVLRHQGLFTFSVPETRARPGDPIHVWIEGTDLDDENGPNMGRSESLRIVVASESTRRERVARRLAEAMDLGLGALADRLENEDFGSPERLAFVGASTENYATILQAIGEEDPEGIDGSVLRAMGTRVRRGLVREQRAHRGGRASASAARRVDTPMIPLFEDQILLLADLVAQVRLEDAASIARELDALRREMTSLLEELQRTDSPQAREDLLAAIARAHARLQELSARLASLREASPSEFVNRESMDSQPSEDALSAFEQAVREGDFERAERQLLELQREIDRLAGSTETANAEMGSGRPGPRERAMAEALDLLSGLEREQAQLSGRSEDTRQAATAAALEDAGDALAEEAQRLESDVRAAADVLRAVPENRLGRYDSETRAIAIARLEDAADALAAGDFGEGREMARAAQRNVQRLARELELSAMMYGGRNGVMAEASQAAQRAAQATRELAGEINAAIPRVQEHLAENGRAQLAEDSPRQSAAREAAERLSALFRSEPDGSPLSPESAESVDSAMEAMRGAETAMEAREPMGTAQNQAEAARQLSELRDKLEEQQRQEQESGGGGGESTPRERIALPGEGERRDDRRRELLDGMQRRAPAGFEEANRRYYEGLLR
ncbi:MAG: DUF4175 family protein [Polyangiales bacterium]